MPTDRRLPLTSRDSIGSRIDLYIRYAYYQYYMMVSFRLIPTVIRDRL